MKNIEEIWKDIDGYEGLYQVSNLGRIKSLQRYVWRGNGIGGNSIVKEKIKKKDITNLGYERTTLSKDNIDKHYSVHRLVAQAFIPNPDNLPVINHKDENPSNNHVDNLEWCTYQYNSIYGTLQERKREKQINHPQKSKVVYQYSLSGELIKEWKSGKEVERQLGFDQGSISKCCSGKQKTCGGYKWEYNYESA